MKVRVTKITDNVFNNDHPNGVNEGFSVEGFYINEPTVGERFVVVNKGLHTLLSTSPVTEVLDNGLFKTENSTYKIEEIIEEDD
jgi:hypothetical protein